MTDLSGGEIGDKCNFDYSNTVENPQTDGHDAPCDETTNCRGYWIQGEWSNQTHSCVDRFTSSGRVAHASFTECSGAGSTVNFNVGSSTATGGAFEYAWQFGDRSAAAETTSPTLAHRFAAATPS